MDMQIHLKYNLNIFSECLVKGAILAFSALFLSFYFDAPKKKLKPHKKLVLLFFHGDADGRAMLQGAYYVHCFIHFSECTAAVRGAILCMVLCACYHYIHAQEGVLTSD